MCKKICLSSASLPSQLPISHDDVFGDYTCVARNHLGSLRKVITLAEGAKPGVPHVTVENIGQVKALIILTQEIRCVKTAGSALYQ